MSFSNLLKKLGINAAGVIVTLVMLMLAGYDKPITAVTTTIFVMGGTVYAFKKGRLFGYVALGGILLYATSWTQVSSMNRFAVVSLASIGVLVWFMALLVNPRQHVAQAQLS